MTKASSMMKSSALLSVQPSHQTEIQTSSAEERSAVKESVLIMFRRPPTARHFVMVFMGLGNTMFRYVWWTHSKFHNMVIFVGKGNIRSCQESSECWCKVPSFCKYEEKRWETHHSDAGKVPGGRSSFARWKKLGLISLSSQALTGLI